MLNDMMILLVKVQLFQKTSQSITTLSLVSAHCGETSARLHNKSSARLCSSTSSLSSRNSIYIVLAAN
jgi:hypothetical protein